MFLQEVINSANNSSDEGSIGNNDNDHNSSNNADDDAKETNSTNKSDDVTVNMDNINTENETETVNSEK